jgi:hypothetical protein
MSNRSMKLLSPLRNTCCIQELNTQFKAYGDIRAAFPERERGPNSNPLLIRQSRFLRYYTDATDSRKGLAKIESNAAGVISDRVSKFSLKSERKAVSADTEPFTQASIISEYQPLLEKLAIKRTELNKTLKYFSDLINDTSSKRESLKFIEQNWEMLDEPLMIRIMSAISLTLHEHAKNEDKNTEIANAIRYSADEAAKLGRQIKLYMSSRIEDDDQRIDLRDVLGVILYRAMLFPAVPTRSSTQLQFMVNNVDLGTSHGDVVRDIINSIVSKVKSVLQEHMIPSQTVLFDYITRMRESQKREKIAKYESMSAYMKEDAKIVKAIKMDHVLFTEPSSENAAIETTDPFENALGDGEYNVQDFVDIEEEQQHNEDEI